MISEFYDLFMPGKEEFGRCRIKEMQIVKGRWKGRKEGKTRTARQFKTKPQKLH